MEKLGHLISAALTFGLIATGIAHSLGLGVGDTSAARRHARRLGLGFALLGGSSLATDLTVWTTLPLATSVFLWLLSGLLIGAGLWLFLNLPARHDDVDK